MTSSPPLDLRHRFPGLGDGWSRFDGPAGTQVVDSAAAAVAAHMSSPGTANGGGPFPQSRVSDETIADARATVATLLGTGDGGAGIAFGPSMTMLTFHVTRAIAQGLGPGDRVVGTALDHDANVTPWARACRDSGATHELARFDPETGRLDLDHLASLVDERTRWIAVTGASNALGTRPDLRAIVGIARTVGARVFVDAVHLAAHAAVDAEMLGCDAVVSSSYKWYGPHAGILWLAPDLVHSLAPAKVRPAPDAGPGRWEQGTPQYEVLAGVAAAARFLLDVGLRRLELHEQTTFAPLLEGLLALPNVAVHGPSDLVDRTPTVSFTVEGRSPAELAAHLADRRCAAWHGTYYAVEAMRALGLGDQGAVRVGVSLYTTPEDVQRLLEAVSDLR